MATTGVTCRITAKGNRLISSGRDSAKSAPRPTPPTMASTSAITVSLIVNQAETIRLGPSVISVDHIRDGAGIR